MSVDMYTPYNLEYSKQDRSNNEELQLQTWIQRNLLWPLNFDQGIWFEDTANYIQHKQFVFDRIKGNKCLVQTNNFNKTLTSNTMNNRLELVLKDAYICLIIYF